YLRCLLCGASIAPDPPRHPDPRAAASTKARAEPAGARRDVYVVPLLANRAMEVLTSSDQGLTPTDRNCQPAASTMQQRRGIGNGWMGQHRMHNAPPCTVVHRRAWPRIVARRTGGRCETSR